MKHVRVLTYYRGYKQSLSLQQHLSFHFQNVNEIQKNNKLHKKELLLPEEDCRLLMHTLYKHLLT